jgi:hypothetical protein
MTLTIYRGISTNGTINSEAIGTSWTLDMQYAIQRAEEMQALKGHEVAIVFEAKITLNQIDWELTLGAFENADNAFEFEVVLMPYVDIAVRTAYASDDSEATFAANTGAQRIDETMAEYSGDDFHGAKLRWLEMANEF